MWCGMTVEDFIKDERRQVHWADAAFYQKYPQYIPHYLKPEPKPKPVQQRQPKKESGCVIC